MSALLTATADQCPSQGALANGVVTGGTTTGAVQTFACNSGFYLSGASTATCLPGQTWSAPLPSCFRTLGLRRVSFWTCLLNIYIYVCSLAV